MLYLLGFRSKRDKFHILFIEHGGKGFMPGRNGFHFHPKLEQGPRTFRLIVDSCEFIVELDKILLELLPDLSFLLEQIDPSRVYVSAPFDE